MHTKYEVSDKRGGRVMIIRVQKFENIIMKYLETIGVVGMVCVWVCPGICGVYVYEV
jgi:hypothetical protein